MCRKSDLFVNHELLRACFPVTTLCKQSHHDSDYYMKINEKVFLKAIEKFVSISNLFPFNKLDKKNRAKSARSLLSSHV
jgi:hypothetical protein